MITITTTASHYLLPSTECIHVIVIYIYCLSQYTEIVDIMMVLDEF